ncbi:hypothetical protein JCM11641_002619 [Rhodosporidiobolus odoratus]
MSPSNSRPIGKKRMNRLSSTNRRYRPRLSRQDNPTASAQRIDLDGEQTFGQPRQPHPYLHPARPHPSSSISFSNYTSASRISVAPASWSSSRLDFPGPPAPNFVSRFSDWTSMPILAFSDFPHSKSGREEAEYRPEGGYHPLLACNERERVVLKRERSAPGLLDRASLGLETNEGQLR